MEEVTGSIPVRSTKHLNNLDGASARSREVCVTVCVITGRFGADSKGFHRCPLGFHPYVTVPFQHATADVSGNRHDRRIGCPALGKLGNCAVPKVVEPETGQSRFLRQGPPSRSPAIDVLCRVKGTTNWQNHCPYEQGDRCSPPHLHHHCGILMYAHAITLRENWPTRSVSDIAI
jgi:hypothetical protein